jgi:hypothetical protein
MITNALKRSDGNINYPGIIAAWSAKGKTNDDEDKATLKDLTGNGHDITLNNFSFSEMSGYGGYNYGKGKWELRTMNAYEVYFFNTTPINGNLTFNISGITDFYTKTGNYVQIRYHRKDGGINQYIEIKEDGFYDIDPTTSTTSVGISMRSAGTDTTDAPCNIVLEMIPNYPDALVFDGVDDYGVNCSAPSLSDYTIIVKKKALNNNGVVCATIGNFGEVAFVISDKFNRDNGMVFANSFSWETSVKWVDNISYQTKNSYNGKTISVGKIVTTHGFSISMYGGKYWKGAFYSAYLFDRSLDEQEIKSFIRKYIDPEYLLPSEIPTPDCYYDFSKGSNDDETRDTIKDYSGNGNDAVAHNFAWSGMSGYGGNLYGNYKYHFDTLGKYQSIILDAPIIGNLKFKVTGLTDYFNKTTNYIELRLIRVSDGGADYKEIKEDGEYNIELPTSKYSTISIRSGGVNIEDGTCNIDIEMLPEYEGALVFDGTNDYVSLDAFDSGFKTMFMKFKPINTINAGYYDQIKKGESKYYFSVSGNSSDIAFSYRNTNGKTYINGILNTSILSKDVVNKTVCIGIVNENVTADNTTIPKIGDGTHFTPWFANMALYKFLGFKEALTEEQIQAVIKKYNLLDGVDEIEVS